MSPTTLTPLTEPKRPVVYVSRSMVVKCAHRLHSLALSDEENRAVFGKCNWVHGHGHNYSIRVTCRGTVSSRTGMVINLSTLREVMEKRIFSVFDHKHIDLDVPHFENHPSTAENIAVYVWDVLEKEIQAQGSHDGHVSLYEVQVDETDENRAVYRGEMV